MKNFPCQLVSLEEVEKVIKSLDIKKSALSESIKAFILKVHSNTYLPYLTNIINKCFEDCPIPDELKWAEIVPIYKDYPLDKENCRPVSLLSHVSNIFEKLI